MSAVVYIIGCAIAAFLVIVYFFGSEERDFNTMLNYNDRDRAYVALVIGFVPMLLASAAFYNLNFGKETEKPKHRLRFLLIMIPVIVCGIPTAIIVGALAVGYFNMFVSKIREFVI
jgi:hypothetical protein